jgi:hypothetical protein
MSFNLAVILSETARSSSEAPVVVYDGGQLTYAEILTTMLGLSAPMWLALGTQAAYRMPQPLVQTVATNVPGPRIPLYVLGRRMTALHPNVPIGNAVRISIAILSYLDTVSFGVTADYDSVPDVDVLVQGIQRALAELAAQPSRPPVPGS